MLERASSSAECAAHIFLRGFEAPIRSHRSLGPAFWRHASDYVDVPAWWTSYLNDRRRMGHSLPSNSQHRTAASGSPLIQRRQSTLLSQSTSRTFTNSLSRPQLAPAQIPENIDVEIEDSQDKIRARNSKGTIDTFRTSLNDVKPKKSKTKPWISKSETAKSHQDEKRIAEIGQAWNDFARTGWKTDRASSLLHFLATSENRDHLLRAVHAFELIPQEKRTPEDYRVIVDVSIKLTRYSLAVQVIKEAISKNLDQGISFKFLALSISKGFWNTAADLWKQMAQQRSLGGRFPNKGYVSNKKNFAGYYAYHFDIIADLPSKLVAITDRLQDDDPVLANRKHELSELCKNLLLAAVESERVMGLITGDELLSLFSVQEQLGFESDLHFAAIATIDRLPEKGTKHHLAMSTYRSFKYRYPTKFVPKWVFGTLIKIYSAARLAPEVHRALLEDIRVAYGVIDDGIYIQAIRACANQGEVASVYTMFEDFYQNSRTKSADVLNLLIRVHAVTGDYQKAQDQFNKVRTHFGYEPSIRNWNALLLAYSRSSQSERAYEIFWEMQRHQIQPDQHSWSMIVDVAAKRGDTKAALRLVRDAKEAGITPPIAMIGAVVDSHLLNNKPDDAWLLVVEATRTSQTSQESPVRLWNSMFRYYAFKANSEAILRLQQNMKEHNVPADSMTYAALMTALVVQKRTQDAAKILRTLHQNQALSANEFHYSILLHGFAMEKRQDMAMSTYREMLERYPRATPSAKLSMLYLQAISDEEKVRNAYLAGGVNHKPDFRPTFARIKDILNDTLRSDLTSPIPNPGFRRRSSRSDLEDIYFGSLITFLHRNDAHGYSREILGLLKDKGSSLKTSGEDHSWTSKLHKLSQELNILDDEQDWVGFAKTWQRIINLALKHATSTDTRKFSPAQESSHTLNLHNIEYIDNAGSNSWNTEFRPFVAAFSQRDDSKVLPAHRFILSMPLSQYIKAYDRQHKQIELIETVQGLLVRGFELSSRNWNGFIQSLCRSSSSDHLILAFELFEKYLLPNAPSWKVIRRGKWILPTEERPRHFWHTIKRTKDSRTDRKTLERLNPALLMPSYYTMIHLASAWLRICGSHSYDNDAVRRSLEVRSPGTLKLVLKTPRIRDRVQGVLLRGRRVIGDRVKRPQLVNDSVKYYDAQRHRLSVNRTSPDLLADPQEQDLSGNEPSRRGNLQGKTQETCDVDISTILNSTRGRNELKPAPARETTRLELFRLGGTPDGKTQAQQKPETSTLRSSVTTAQASPGVVRVPARAKIMEASANKQPAIFMNQIDHILYNVGQENSQPGVAVRARKQNPPISTSSLTKRRLLLLSSPLPGSEKPDAIPLRESRLGHRLLHRQKAKLAGKASFIRESFVRQVTEQRPDPASWRSLRHYRETQKLKAGHYQRKYEVLMAQASTRPALSKRFLKQVKWYKYNAQRSAEKFTASVAKEKKLKSSYPELIQYE